MFGAEPALALGRVDVGAGVVGAVGGVIDAVAGGGDVAFDAAVGWDG